MSSDSSCQSIIERRNMLSPHFQVACIIYEITEVNKEKAYYSKVKEILEQTTDIENLGEYLKFLCSWRIIKDWFEPYEDSARRYFFMSNEDYATIKMLYERYWYDSSHTTKTGEDDE